MILFLQATMQGLALGAVYSLVAIGLVLIYKATDVLSFAQPALAVAGAGIISALAVDRGISFWIALSLMISHHQTSDDFLLQFMTRHDITIHEID